VAYLATSSGVSWEEAVQDFGAGCRYLISYRASISKATIWHVIVSSFQVNVVA